MICDFVFECVGVYVAESPYLFYMTVCVYYCGCTVLNSIAVIVCFSKALYSTVEA